MPTGPWEKRQVLIVVKAYPNPEDEYGEACCTAGVDDDDNWIRISVRPDSDGRNALHLGPFVDAHLLREVGYELLVCSSLVISELVKELGSANPEWGVKAVMFSIEVADWLPTVRPVTSSG